MQFFFLYRRLIIFPILKKCSSLKIFWKNFFKNKNEDNSSYIEKKDTEDNIIQFNLENVV